MLKENRRKSSDENNGMYGYGSPCPLIFDNKISAFGLRNHSITDCNAGTVGKFMATEGSRLL